MNNSGPLLKFGLPLAKNALLPLGLTAQVSATDADIQEKLWVRYIISTFK